MKFNVMKIKNIICLAAIFSVSFLGAAKNKVKGFSHSVLENGLEVFVMENHNAPLVYIEIAVKAGAIRQNPENAGLFHLYEHMMFQGNSLYENSSAVTKAINDMGVDNYNGTTNVEWVNYFFTVPVGQLEKGLEFWSRAIREPLLNPEELENQKKVVLNEIETEKKDEGHLFMNFLNTKFFPGNEFKRNPGGSPEVIRKCTVEQLKLMQQEFYVPNNAALFIGGDVSKKQVIKLVKKYYGDWKRGKDIAVQNQMNMNPLEQDEFYVMPYSKISEQMAEIEIYWRGVDLKFDAQSSYSIDAVCSMLRNPEGNFCRDYIENENFNIPSENYLWFSYPSSGECALMNLGAVTVGPFVDLPGLVKRFYSFTRSRTIQEIKQNNMYFTEDEFLQTKRSLETDNIWQTDNVKSFLTSARFFWITGGSDYYLNYADNVEKVNVSDVQKFAGKYFDNNCLTVVLVNPKVYELFKSGFESNGFKNVLDEKIIWWEK